MRHASASGRPPGFIFRGLVERAPASLLDQVPAKDAAVVRVEEVLHGTRSLQGYGGIAVTVRALDIRALAAQTRSVFFTEPLLFGATLAVDEVEPPADLEDPRLPRRLNVPERLVRWRASRADLVVLGRVVDVRPAAAARPIRLNDPEWHLASVQVERAWRNTTRLETVSLLFPASRRRSWARAPKVEMGQRALWLLRRAGIGERDWYTALHPCDVAPAERQAIVEEGGLL